MKYFSTVFILDIYLEIQGIGRCEWSDQQKNKRLYTGDEKYLSHKTEFFSANDGNTHRYFKNRWSLFKISTLD